MDSCDGATSPHGNAAPAPAVAGDNAAAYHEANAEVTAASSLSGSTVAARKDDGEEIVEKLPRSKIPSIRRRVSHSSSSSSPTSSNPMSSPLPDVAATAQAAFLMTSTNSTPNEARAHAEADPAPIHRGDDENDAGLDDAPPSAASSLQLLPDVVLRDDDAAADGGDETDDDAGTESESKPEALDLSAATISSADSEQNHDSTSMNAAAEEPKKEECRSSAPKKRPGGAASASASGAVTRRSIKAPTARKTASIEGKTNDAAGTTKATPASTEEPKKFSRSTRLSSRTGAGATNVPSTPSFRRTASASAEPKPASTGARAAAGHKSSARSPRATPGLNRRAVGATAASTAPSANGKSLFGASSQAKGRSLPTQRPGSPSKSVGAAGRRPASPALSEASSKSSTSGVKGQKTPTEERPRITAQRSETVASSAPAASKTSRRLKEQQKDNIRSTKEGDWSKSREQKENIGATSPPKTRAAAAAAAASSSASTKKVATTPTSDGRSSRLPKSISNNSMKTAAASASAAKSELAAKEERLRQLETELQQQQDLVSSKSKAVVKLEAEAVAATEAHDQLDHDNRVLQNELRKYSICAMGLAVVSQHLGALLGASRVQAAEARTTLMLELKAKEAQILEIEERLGRVEMDLIRSIREQEQCQNDMKEQQKLKIEMEEELQDVSERLSIETRKNKMLEDRVEEEKRENLRLESSLWRAGEASRRKKDKVDAAVGCSLEARNLDQEVESLKVVLDMKNEEIRKCRQRLDKVSKKEEELMESRRTVQRLEQKVEDLTAMLSAKTDQERQLHQEKQQLRVERDREAQAKKRISMENEELMYRLSHSSLNDTLGADSLSVSLPNHRRTPSVTHSPPSSPIVPGSAGAPHPASASSFYPMGAAASSASSPMHCFGSPRVTKSAKFMSRSLGPYENDSVFNSGGSSNAGGDRKLNGATPASSGDAQPVGRVKGGRRFAWDSTDSRSSADLEESPILPPSQRQQLLQQQVSLQQQQSQNGGAASSSSPPPTSTADGDTPTTSVTNGGCRRPFGGRSDEEKEEENEEEEEESKPPPAAPAVSMADSDSRNGREGIPDPLVQREVDVMEMQDHDHDDDTSAAVESLSEGNNGGEASEGRRSSGHASSGQESGQGSGRGSGQQTSASSERKSHRESWREGNEDEDEDEHEEVQLRRHPGRRFHDTDVEETEEDIGNDDDDDDDIDVESQ